MTVRTLMAVHAHPDDEVISTGGILARYAEEGVRTVVVTCTDGSQGFGPGGAQPGEPGHDPDAVANTRRDELNRSGSLPGVDHLRCSATAIQAWPAGLATPIRTHFAVCP